MARSDIETSSGSEYQVYLSFRGLDIGVGFTNMLFRCLTVAGISVFRDDEELHVGERIDRPLQRTIDNSRIYIPVFSRTYASSQYCLNELTQIFANTFRSEGYKEILPIFFDVEPDDVQLKTLLYRDAIRNLEREKKLSKEQVDTWREALVVIGAIHGWEAKNYRGHDKLLKLVVEKVIEKLKIVGIDDRVQEVCKLLDVNSGGVRLINIYGFGGIGKTTLAKVVFNRVAPNFGEYCCFLEDVREKSSRTDALVELQKKLLSEIGHPAGARRIDEIDYGKMIEEALCKKKVLIVFDDVDSSEQVEKLAGNGILFSGSRILVTTRNKGVVGINRLKYQVLDYEMELMSTNHALELFSRHAFNKASPLDEYNKLSREIVSTVGRLPLALEVIGSSLYHKKQELWEEILEKLKKPSQRDVFETLKISYDALTFEHQQIFLDIACFFVGEDNTNAFYMWKDCEFSPDIGVDVLISRSLVKIVENNKFWMHNQLRDLGREIVRRENPTNPRMRSRIWSCEEFLDAMRTDEISENVQAIYLNIYPQSSRDFVVQSRKIGRFKHLRFLKLTGGTFVGDTTTRLTELGWTLWNYLVCIYKWTNMYLENVVILEFSSVDFLNKSRLQNLIKMARKLKILSLKSCHNIIRTPDFSGCPNLERLTFEDCSNLRKIDGSIGKLKHLIDLKIDICFCLEDLPKEIGDLVNMKHFFMKRCNVKKLPDSIWKLKSLRELHFSSDIDKSDSTNSWEIPSTIEMLQNLEVLQVNSHYLKGQIPSGIGNLPSLTILNLSLTRVSEVPETIRMLPRLQRLELMECHKIEELPMLPTSLTHLRLSSASLRVVPDLSNLTNLIELHLDDSGGGGDKLCTCELSWIGRLSKLTKLSLGLHNVPAPAELASLPQLNQLDLFGLDLQTFPQHSLSLQKLGLDNFNSIASLSPNLRNLSCLELSRSPIQEFRLDGLQLPHLRELLVQSCLSLERFRLSSMRKLKDVQVRDCPKLVDIRFSRVFESLEALSIKCCKSLRRLVNMREVGHDNSEPTNELITYEGRLILPSRSLNKLHSFILAGCHKIQEIQIEGMSESWEHFELGNCPYVQSFGGLSNLKNLKSIQILHNEGLRVVEGLDKLEFLDNLQVHGCGSLERLIDVSSTKLPNNCHINISGSGKDFRGTLESYRHHKVSRL